MVSLFQIHSLKNSYNESLKHANATYLEQLVALQIVLTMTVIVIVIQQWATREQNVTNV